MNWADRGFGEERTSIIDVPRGLFCLRYLEPVDANAPLVLIQPIKGCEHLIQVMPFPGASATSLERPGHFLVISSLGSARLQITVRPIHSRVSHPAQLELQPIDRLLPVIPGVELSRSEMSIDDRADAGRSSPRYGFEDSSKRHPTGLGSDIGLAVVGHVARLGDVRASAGNWIAGPAAPAPIEGVLFQMAPSASYWFEAQVLISGEPGWTDWRVASQFIGTKGRSLPLIGVRLRTSESAPSDIEIEASALFLGSPVIKRTGRQIELRSGAGGDPLVGLCFDLYRKQRLPETIGTPPKHESQVRGRVRVFRAGVERVAS